MLVYGPVPSRRLGRSLGLNNIPYKYCTYSCIYCQVGRTTKMQAEPVDFYRPEALLQETKARIGKVGADGHAVDYISFVPDGEPTLDRNLGTLITMLKRDLSYPVAVITNGSLLWREEVAAAVSLADWVSVKVDTVVESMWRRVNRPDRRLEFAKMLEGIRTFSSQYGGELVSETMLVDGENTDGEGLAALAEYVREISPRKAYLSIPSRPPAKPGVRVPDEEQLNRARQAFETAGLKVECLTRYEGGEFAVTADAAQDILSIAAVHPLREDALRQIVQRSAADWKLVERLLAEGRLRKNVHNRETYYRTVS
jgi:wyosine [tRNA(Phe)-imidazoG37] synthetase (radical SAM superfamily)